MVYLHQAVMRQAPFPDGFRHCMQTTILAKCVGIDDFTGNLSPLSLSMKI